VVQASTQLVDRSPEQAVILDGKALHLDEIESHGEFLLAERTARRRGRVAFCC
jgi:hypothetical protein